MDERYAIWTEKYRPTEFSQVIGQDDIVRKVEAFVKQKNMPHLLFSGPAGVGKTTLSLVTARALFKDNWESNFLELNASDERGIDVIRLKVKEFARSRALGDVPFKIIYLDECDALTKEAQQALRRTMENYTQTCRFILSCNYSSKIIDPIQSRCTVFKFKPLQEEHLRTMTERISQSEKLKINDQAKQALITVCHGDCRRLENILQAAAALSKTITETDVYELASLARPKEIQEVLEACITGDFSVAKKKLLDTMLAFGLSGLDVVSQLQREIWGVTLPARVRLAMVSACGESEFRMVEGSDEFIQLEALLATFCSLALESSKQDPKPHQTK
jgi:replication factor C small subunit